MNELEEAWALVLAEAETRARAAGRKDLVEYLALRKSNDLLRMTGINWLIATFESLAGEANSKGSNIHVAKDDSHHFRVGNATMAGPLLTLSTGVRKLSVEAGWPRAPRDGFVRGGGLACAHIKHFGIKSANVPCYCLVRPGVPRWIGLEKKHPGLEFMRPTFESHRCSSLHSLKSGRYGGCVKTQESETVMNKSSDVAHNTEPLATPTFCSQ